MSNIQKKNIDTREGSKKMNADILWKKNYRQKVGIFMGEITMAIKY